MEGSCTVLKHPQAKDEKSRDDTVLSVACGAFSTAYQLLQAGTFSGVSRSVLGAPAGTLGAIYDREGIIIGASVRHGGFAGDKVVELNPPHAKNIDSQERISGRTIYLGPFMAHYGHFITESVSRCWLIDHDHFDNIVYHPFIFGNTRANIHDFHRVVWSAFNIDEKKIKIVRHPAVFDEIWVPEQLWRINLAPSPVMRRVYDHLSGSSQPAFDGDRNLFLTVLDKSRSRLRNISDLELLLSKLGFAAVFLDETSMPEQLNLFKNARVVVALSGSSMHNVVFAEHGSRWIEIGDPRSPDDFMAMQIGANMLARAEVKKIPFVGEDGNVDLEWVESNVRALL